MKDRIQRFIDYKGITPGELAEIIDVQRSNISHILNGRNKPGAAFIEKFLIAFPNVNARWFLTGEGSMLIKGAEDEERDKLPKKHIKEGKIVDKSPTLPFDTPQSHSSEEKRKVAKIILLFTDGTFTTYSSI